MNVEVEMLSAGQATAFSIEECQTRIRSNIDSGLRDLYKLSFFFHKYRKLGVIEISKSEENFYILKKANRNR